MRSNGCLTSTGWERGVAAGRIIRISHRFAVVIVAIGLLSLLVNSAGASAHPTLEPDSGKQVDAGEGVHANPVSGEFAQDVPRYFLRRDDCGGDADNLHLSLTAGDPDGGDGCGFIPPGWNALNEGFALLGDEEGLVQDYPARDGLPFTLDGSTDITGTIVIQSFKGVGDNPVGLGAGVSRAHFTLTGQGTDEPGRDTLGQATVEYLVTPDQDTYELDFQMPASAERDGAGYRSLNFRVRLDGPAVNHGFVALSGRSFVDLPGTPGEGGGAPAPEVPTERLTEVACTDGQAGPFECDGVDLLAFVPKAEFEGAEGSISDIWGWTDPATGGEYVMFGKTDGVAFFRVTDPTDPVYLGELPNAALVHEVWHDIKVFDNHAFIVSESEPHGMTVFDLTRLRGVEEPREWDQDAFYRLNAAAHNVVINEDTGFAYIVGGNAGIVVPDQCLSGLHMVDINDPKNPTFAGCYLEEGGPGTAARTVGGPVQDNSPAAYVHDAQCVIYEGPDERYTGREICFNAAETQVVIADVTDKLLPTTLGTVTYDNAAYTHQGWLTEDQAFWIVNDELDEEEGLVDNTRTIVLDVRDLENPKVHFEHLHDTISPDHNNYVHEGLLYQSNYSSGLRVLDIAAIDDPDAPGLDEVAFFDTFPAAEDTFDGTWSNYPFFESGTIAVSGRNEGLFLLRLADDEPATAELGVELTTARSPVRIEPGEAGTAGLLVSNRGEADDTYQLTVSGLPAGWTATIDPEELTVQAGSDALAAVTIEVPPEQRPGRSTFTVTATSTTDGDVTASADVAVVVRKAPRAKA